jgi:hypothetical protein
MTLLEELTRAAEREWLDGWAVGPTEDEGPGRPVGAEAPDLALADQSGRQRLLSEFWSGRPALLMFWRHFGCGCGVARAQRLKAEWADYVEAGLNPVIVAGHPWTTHGGPWRSSSSAPTGSFASPTPTSTARTFPIHR